MGYKIGIVGLGNIGRRHLEGLSYLPIEIDKLFLCDQNRKALDLARQPAEQVQAVLRCEVEFCESLDRLPNGLDLVIVATTARNRENLIETLIENNITTRFILEKILFDNIDAYGSIAKRLASSSCKAWVNCPRRLWSDYSKIKSHLKEQEISSIEVTGGLWGMACNSIHFLDLISYLCSNNDPLIIDKKLIFDESLECKRSGYEEIAGELVGNKGSCKFVISDFGMPSQVLIKINAARDSIIINESDGFSVWWEKGKGKPSLHTFSAPYQSQISYKPVQSILSSDTCDLATFKESSVLHQVLLACLEKHFSNLGYPRGVFPIT